MSDSCNPVDWSLPSSIHGISQVRILEWVALSFSIEIALLFQQFLFYNFWVFSHTTGITHFIELCLPVLHRYCAFYQLKVCSNSALSKSISAIFSKAVIHFVSLCHSLVILTIFQTFHYYYIFYDDLWSVIFLCYYCSHVRQWT